MCRRNLPGPPASVALSVVAEDKLGITINAPEDDGGAHVTHYLVDVYPASPCVSAKTSGLEHFWTVNRTTATLLSTEVDGRYTY